MNVLLKITTAHSNYIVVNIIGRGVTVITKNPAVAFLLGELFVKRICIKIMIYIKKFTYRNQSSPNLLL